MIFPHWITLLNDFKWNSWNQSFEAINSPLKWNITTIFFRFEMVKETSICRHQNSLSRNYPLYYTLGLYHEFIAAIQWISVSWMDCMWNFAYSLIHRPIFSMVQSWIAVIKWNYEHSHIACMWIIKFICIRCINKTMAEVDVKNVHFTVLSKNGA